MRMDPMFVAVPSTAVARSTSSRTVARHGRVFHHPFKRERVHQSSDVSTIGNPHVSGCVWMWQRTEPCTANAALSTVATVEVVVVVGGSGAVGGG